MKSSVDRLDDTTVKVAIEVPFSEMEPEFDKAYKEIAKQINVPGFRRGKAPRKVVESRVSREYVLGDVFNEAIPSRLNSVLEEEKLKLLGTPSIEVTSAADADPLAFEATFSVSPEFTVPDFSKISVEVDPIEVTDEAIDEEIEKLRVRFSTLKDVKRKAKKDDVVTFNVKVEVEGKEIPEAAAEGLTHTIGSEIEMIEGLDKAVKGLHADESATFEAPVPMAEGKTGTVTVDVTAVKGRQLPEVDEEFVQEASEFDTVEELREGLKSQLEDAAKSQQAVALRDAVLEKAFEAAAFPIPTRYVDEQVQNQIDNMARQFGGEAGLAEVMKMQNTTLDEYKKTLEEQFTQTVRTQILLDAVADLDEPTVTNDDVNEHLMFTASSYGMDPQTLLNQLAQAGQLPSLFQDVRRGKALAASICKVSAKDTAGNVIDTTEYFGEESEAEAETEEK
ncbi:MAG: trigger factor [Corynebacterium sp.]|nr:trigger factor [Corynebacterium sp.]